LVGAGDVIDVVVRCRNEMPHAQATLERMARQRSPRARVLFLDCRSEDGSRESAAEAGCEIVEIDPQAYVPGRALNLGMTRTRSRIVAFVNADAIPLDDGSLGRLIEPFRDERVVASFGRQIARGDADRITRLDHERTFGPDAPVKTRRGVFFSMAASAVRREVWQRLPFDEALHYSEDVDWAYRVTALGYRVAYVPGAHFEHSHSYDLEGQFRRRRGEGKADGAIFRLGRPSFGQDFVRPLAGWLLRDVRTGLVSPYAVATRLVQSTGYFVGRRDAVRAP
jgi:GT2 family glycosyltransferase